MTGFQLDKTVETIQNTDSTSEIAAAPTGKQYSSHAETVEQTEKNVGLRIDGDELDHEHEPKVHTKMSS